MKLMSILVASLALGTAQTAQAEVRSVVLVRSAFADGSGWKPVAVSRLTTSSKGFCEITLILRIKICLANISDPRIKSHLGTILPAKDWKTIFPSLKT